jgi:hypothetical protein
MDRFQRALNDAAVRLTGTEFGSIPNDGPAQELVLEEVHESFIRKLSDADLAVVMRELERIAFGGDTEAMELAWREALEGVKWEALGAC